MTLPESILSTLQAQQGVKPSETVAHPSTGLTEPSRAIPAPNPQDVTLTPEQEEELVKRITAAIDHHQSSFKPYLDKIEEWQKLFTVTPKAKTKPWVGSSNFPVPFIAEKVMSIHARLVRAIFNVDPIFLVNSRLPVPPEVTQRIETFFDHVVDRSNLRQVMDIALLHSLIEGTAIVKIDYHRQTREVASSIPEVSQQMGTASPTDPNKEVFTEFEGVRCSFVPLKDFVIFPMQKFSIDDAQGCGHRFYLTKSQLLNRDRRGIYKNAQTLIDNKLRGNVEQLAQNPILKNVQQLPPEVVEMYELWEIFIKHDIEGTGDEVPLLVTISKDSGTILRVIKFPYDHGKAPYIPIRPIPQPNFFYGIALSQFLEPIQKELTASFQRRADALARAAMPPILRQRGSTWNPVEDPLQPAGVITVSSPQEITALQLPDYRGTSIQHEQLLIGLGERLTGISDYQLGRSAGSNRTFGEVRSILAEGEVRIDVMLARIHDSMRALAHLIFDITYQFMPYGGLAAVGQQAFKVTREQMRPPAIGFEAYEFLPNGTLSEASREQKLERTMVLAQQIMQNPLLMSPETNPQAPAIAAQFAKRMLVEAGWRDWETFLPQIAQYQEAAAQGIPNPLEQQQMQQQQQQMMMQQLAMQQQQVAMEKEMSIANRNNAIAAAQQQPQAAPTEIERIMNGQ